MTETPESSINDSLLKIGMMDRARKEGLERGASVLRSLGFPNEAAALLKEEE